MNTPHILAASAAVLALTGTGVAMSAPSPADKAQESYANGTTSAKHVAITRAADLASAFFGHPLTITRCRVRAFAPERFFTARCRVRNPESTRVAVVAGRFYEDGSPRSFRVRLAISAARAN